MATAEDFEGIRCDLYADIYPSDFRLALKRLVFIVEALHGRLSLAESRIKELEGIKQ